MIEKKARVRDVNGTNALLIFDVVIAKVDSNF